ncbi:TRAUB family protein [Heterostelium album PN500]|uniref:TRAUB family protein n=1 Tax=Heterostelium pallidum (strain ATCC 26659 / Pp 5 / PN500) TaxID=670386 RepID=D3BMB4_HETP5|nr:TRAUB family protein [Heterostelium album PN500]EFA77715.1 TRAUB family protein [Heterostelium album PN500]|eukprot:XP_020429843.1 TRAUB family protein [Heterostelium album PN500]
MVGKTNKKSSGGSTVAAKKKNDAPTKTRSKPTTLSDEITQLVSDNAPKSFDPESAEFGDVSLYKPTDEDFGDIMDDNNQNVRIRGEIPSAFTTGKYAGKKSSRKENDLEEDEDEEEDFDDDVDNQDDIDDAFEFEDRVLSSNTIDEADILMKQLEQEGDEQDDDEDTEQPKLVSKNSAISALEELEKAKNTKNQTDLFDEFLTTRIHLQKTIGIANRLPKPVDHKLLLQDEEIKLKFEEAVGEAKSLLGDLFSLQSELVSRNSEIQQHKQQSNKRLRESDTLGDIWTHIEEQNTRLFKFAGESIEKWNNRVNLTVNTGSGGSKSSKNLKSINQSIMTQVNNTLNDIERLHKRTRLKRSQYTIFGQQQQQQQNNNNNSNDKKIEEYDDEIFDDTDFYQVLLKEIEKTSTNEQEIGSQYWKEMQALKKKNKKRPTNNKASKGRQLRYETFTKLENFMPPVPAPLPPWNLDDLFSNLFGGIGVGDAITTGGPSSN